MTLAESVFLGLKIIGSVCAILIVATVVGLALIRFVLAPIFRLFMR